MANHQRLVLCLSIGLLLAGGFGYKQWQDANKNWCLVIIELLYQSTDRKSLTQLPDEVIQEMGEADERHGRVSKVTLLGWRDPSPGKPFECELIVNRGAREFKERFIFGGSHVVAFDVDSVED